MQRSAKERQSKPGFPPPPPMKILHKRDLMAIQECPHNDNVYNNSLRLSSVPLIS